VTAVCAFIGLFCRCVGLLCGQSGFAGSLEEPSHWRACLLFVGETDTYRALLWRDRALLHKSLGGHLGSVLVVSTLV